MNIKNELREWIEAGCATKLFLEPKKYKGENLYHRFCPSMVGYFLFLLCHKVGWHTSLIFDPLHSGGLFRHLRTFFYNLWYVDIFYPTKYRIYRLLRSKFYKEQDRVFSAFVKAMQEGYTDEMESPPFLPAERFHGAILGKRYFNRVKELLNTGEKGKIQ